MNNPKKKAAPSSSQKKVSKKGPSFDDVKKIPGQLKTRAQVLVLMLEVQKGASLQHSLDRAFQDFSPQERGFALELLMGSLRDYIPLQMEVRKCLAKPLKSSGKWLEALLVLGAYQLTSMNTPARAVIHSMVEIVRTLGYDHLVGLANGVLRGVQRNIEAVNGELKPLAIHDYLNEGHWLHAELFKNWRKEYFPGIMQGYASKPPLYMRISRKVAMASYLEQLKTADIAVRMLPDTVLPVPQCIQLEESQRVSDLPGYHEGLLSIQDYSAQACVQALVNQIETEGWLQAEGVAKSQPLKVLDACAAPGGKTAALIDLLPEKTMIHAVDIESSRVERIRENMHRLNVLSENLALICADLSKPHEIIDQVAHDGGYDVILLDAPCSGTGVIARHPDIFWCRREEDIQVLVETQRHLLKRAEALLKPGGLLMYATCSILKRENTDNIEWFMTEGGSQLEVVPMDARLGLQQAYGYQRLPLPDSDGDGFYYVLLRKPR